MPTTTNDYVDVTDTVQVKNIGTTSWRCGWDSKKYIAQPGKSVFVPMHVVINEFGDPRSTETARIVTGPSGRTDAIPTRSSEVARLCQQYGSYDDIPKLVRNAPKVELYDQNGDRFLSVIEDIDGTSAMQPASVDTDERSSLYSTIAKLTARLDALEGGEKIDRTTASDDPGDDDDSELIGTKPDNPGDEFSAAFAGGVKMEVPESETA